MATFAPTDERSINTWIKQRRRALDLTQEELAECVGCSGITIQKIELGYRRPSKQIAQRLAECLRVPPEERDEFVSRVRGEKGDAESLIVEAPASDRAAIEPPGYSTHASTPAPVRLPTPLTPLIGQESMLNLAQSFLLSEDIRLLTLVGPPGIGKTRLGLQISREGASPFKDGVFFVELGPISDPSLVASTIATTLGLRETGDRSILDVLRQFLAEKKMLLLLDNFEQVLDAAPLVIELLSRSPALKVLVTSREALHIPGEQQLPVPPLELPDLSRLSRIEDLAGCPSVALFIQRARAVDPGFPMTRGNTEEIAAICTRLGGLPLAIELAAGQVKLLSTGEILLRLDEQLKMLTNPSAARYEHARHLPARQQTMRAAIEWSYRLLDREEQKILSRLGTFVGGWTLEAAEAVCGPEASDGIGSLLEKSLLKREEGEKGEKGTERESRFTMLESIREFAVEHLQASGEAEEMQRRHALYFLDLAERAEPHLTGEEQAEWFQRLEREHSNVRAAISWSLARGAAEEDIALRFGGALMTFWYNRYPAEGKWWLEGALKEVAGKPSLERARALYSAGVALRKTRQYPQARSMIEESLRIYRELDDEWGIASLLHRLADIMIEAGSPEERGLAERLQSESLDRFRQMKDSAGMSRVLNSAGEWARVDRDYPRAIDAYERSLALAYKTADDQCIATTQTNLAYVLYHQGDYDRAKALLTEALIIYKEIASAYSAGWALFAWAGISRAQGDLWKAARLAVAAGSLAAPGGAPFDPIDQLDREEIEADIRAALSDDEWQEALDEGRAMRLDEAINFAFEEG